jgi:hypothetical protein
MTTTDLTALTEAQLRDRRDELALQAMLGPAEKRAADAEDTRVRREMVRRLL